MTSGRILATQTGNSHILKLTGDVRLSLCSSLNRYIESLIAQPSCGAVLVDLTETEGLDSTTLGMLAKLSVKVRERFGVPTTLVSTNRDVTRILESMGFNEVFVLIDESHGVPPVLDELPVAQASEEEMRQQILEAHRLLMEMNANNREKFRELVDMLEH